MKMVMLIALFCAPMAAQASMIGTWCSDIGEQALFIEADSMGIGEHRVCDWTDAPTSALKFQTKITCRQIYFVDDTPVVIDETDYDFIAQMTEPDKMHTSFDDGEVLFTHDYTRCDG